VFDSNGDALRSATVNGKKLYNPDLNSGADPHTAASAISLGALVGLNSNPGVAGFYASAPGYGVPSEFHAFSILAEVAYSESSEEDMARPHLAASGMDLSSSLVMYGRASNTVSLR
jgi:hypothetical protein